MSTVSSSYSIL
ncbi:cfeb039d-29bb-4747-b928-165d6486b0ec [Thermothielavioides terrestris]|uniref:Cfeb039d-29bb-4747-b928-165d6486b0ec n=1 Tax=Thermothielavioides terrestris TaxID=2587410 RepID=A0A3S4AW44_9PEZI|nr:cfeb039d-29bb-4747-b928-165d6486b0ec [Thermothielavioides terrestris]